MYCYMLMYCYVYMLDIPTCNTRDYIQDVYIKGVLYDKGVHTTWLYNGCMCKLWAYIRLVYIDYCIIGGAYNRWYI